MSANQVTIYICSNTETIVNQLNVTDEVTDIDRASAAIAFVEAAEKSLSDSGLFESASIKNESNFHAWHGAHWNTFGLIGTFADLSPRRQEALWKAADAGALAAQAAINLDVA